MFRRLLRSKELISPSKLSFLEAVTIEMTLFMLESSDCKELMSFLLQSFRNHIATESRILSPIPFQVVANICLIISIAK